MYVCFYLNFSFNVDKFFLNNVFFFYIGILFFLWLYFNLNVYNISFFV